MKLFSKDIIQNRLKIFRTRLIENNIQGALITKRENYIYLSGFTGTFAQLVITRHSAILITDFRYKEQAEVQSPGYEIIQYQGSPVVAVNDAIKKSEISTLGFEEGYITYERHSEYKSKLEVKELVPLSGMVEAMRMVKDQKEIEIISHAVKIADEAFTNVLKYIRPGIKEVEIAAELEYFMRKHGATGPAFETIVASGKRSSMPHGVASDKAIELGDAVTLDFGAVYKGYCSDMTRTVFVGQPDNEMKKIYDIVLKAQLESLEGAHRRLIGKQIDLIARSAIAKAGYENNFGHGLGHGVGLEIHEEPRFSPSGNVEVDNGMVVTVEPGIYINGLGGVRIEDIIVINDDNPIVLTKSAKEMIIL